ncbi:MAG: 4Fe-4S dicluster domain-containing protein [Spirochaetales bacterium]|nr:MAG: 4Fe-4S dicluster domain-containing protein [Spirochaetales bacterium]
METLIINDSLDVNFKYDLAKMPGGSHIKKCFACGTCTAGCPAFHAKHDYNPRKMIRMILMGMKEELLKSPLIWYCQQCYACSANCPQDVDFSHIVMTLRYMAVGEGFAPAALIGKVESLGMAANEFRRNCVSLLLEQEGVTDGAIRKQVEETITMADPEVFRARSAETRSAG